MNHHSEYFWELYRVLKEVLGDPGRLHELSPLAHCDSALEVLIATILTQATSDRNALKAWLNFKAAYKDLSQVTVAGAGLLRRIIRPAGMAVQRSNVILNVLNIIQRQLGEFSLESLKKEPDHGWTFLNSLPGVGPKTAACTLMFGMKLSYFPVDVHIERIAKRLGWVEKTAMPADIQVELGRRIPTELLEDLHILLLNLGRTFCRPRNPNCLGCPLKERCNGND